MHITESDQVSHGAVNLGEDYGRSNSWPSIVVISKYKNHEFAAAMAVELPVIMSSISGFETVFFFPRP